MISMKTDYPTPPIPVAKAKVLREFPIPASSGIYFAWSRGDIAYVGMSLDLSQRLSLPHPKLCWNDGVSWIEFPCEFVRYAEAFYIGALQPRRNFSRFKGSALRKCRPSYLKAPKKPKCKRKVRRKEIPKRKRRTREENPFYRFTEEYARRFGGIVDCEQNEFAESNP